MVVCTCCGLSMTEMTTFTRCSAGSVWASPGMRSVRSHAARTLVQIRGCGGVRGRGPLYVLHIRLSLSLSTRLYCLSRTRAWARTSDASPVEEDREHGHQSRQQPHQSPAHCALNQGAPSRPRASVRDRALLRDRSGRTGSRSAMRRCLCNRRHAWRRQRVGRGRAVTTALPLVRQRGKDAINCGAGNEGLTAQLANSLSMACDSLGVLLLLPRVKLADVALRLPMTRIAIRRSMT